MENTLAARNDLCLGLDEMSQVTAKAASQAAYMIAQGFERGNAMARNGEPLRTRRWRCSVLSTGEIDLETKLAEAGEMARAGQEVRVIGVPAVAGKGFGAFDDLCGTNSGEALAEHLREAALPEHSVRRWSHGSSASLRTATSWSSRFGPCADSTGPNCWRRSADW